MGNKARRKEKMMANPNTAMRYAAKNPYEQVAGYDRRSEAEAESVAASLREEGWDAKVTTQKLWHWERSNGGRHKKYTGTAYNVWKRPPHPTHGQ
jgi:hypothetical protein